MNYAEREKLAIDIDKTLLHFHENHSPLIGIHRSENREALSKQIVDSIARVEYVFTIASRKISGQVCVPGYAFDPLKAAVLFHRKGDFEEACWLVFLAINFGKHGKLGWLLTREVYGALTESPCWTWNRIVQNTNDFYEWLKENHRLMKGKFGNHRKYETLDTARANHNGRTIETYIEWVVKAGGNDQLLLKMENDDPKEAFAKLYKSMSSVARFGRTARFDYLTMLSKTGLVNLEPDRAYIAGATGPKLGINLLVHGNADTLISNQEAEKYIKELGEILPINRMVMQVMEDAICNWQKSPSLYKRFSG